MKKFIIVLIAFSLAVFGAGTLIEPQSRISKIRDDSLCPVVGCSRLECHDYSNVPELDGQVSMVCPEVKTCSSVECHAASELSSGYLQADNASLNMWILMPVILVIGILHILTRKPNAKSKTSQNATDSSDLLKIDGQENMEMDNRIAGDRK